jgi:hypothetical protein
MVNAYGGELIPLHTVERADLRVPLGRICSIRRTHGRDAQSQRLLEILSVSLVHHCGSLSDFRTYVYSQRGEFTYIPPVQGIGSYIPRTVGNSINIVVHVVAAAMYGKVCLKSPYYPIVVDGLRDPLLATPRRHLV